jgi:glycosyltransferase involved in cell wall biosynthesis
VTAVSKHTARTAERHFSIEPTVIYNGVDPSTFHPDHPNSINYPWLRNVENLVIFVGKLISRKRPEDVIKVAKSIDNAHFVLIGDGSKADILSKESKEVNNLTLTGRLSKEKLPPIYANASVLLFPTLREGCPNVVLEALASGTPVVGYNATSMPELVIDGETGFLVEPGNINKLIEKVEILLNGDEQQRYSENARQHAVENHSFNIIAEDYLNVYSQTI